MPRSILLSGLLLLLAAGFSCSTSPMTDARCEDHALYDRFESESGLRVVITLHIDDNQDVRTVQTRFLNTLDGTGYQVIRQPTHMPILALQVDRAAFCRTAESPLVDGIQEDVPEPPTGT